MMVAEAFAAIGNVLQHSLIKIDGPALGTLMGWPHSFNEPREHQRLTAIGTAYGLKLSLLLGEQNCTVDRLALAATLWKLRRPDGGWNARTGRTVSRPEVSALVMGALADGGYRTRGLAAACEIFERGLSQGVNPVAMERTYVVSAIIRGLVRVRPQSAHLTDLRAVLLAGAIRDSDHNSLICWSDHLSPEGDETQGWPPSPAHTAQAIVALVRARDVLGEDTQSQIALDQAIQWLISCRRLDDETEQIKRSFPDIGLMDFLRVDHFTAAWVARALLALSDDPPETATLLAEAVNQVWNRYRDGYWEWNAVNHPISMAYQGACVLHESASRT